MIPTSTASMGTPSAPFQGSQVQPGDDPSFLWIDQYSEEVLLTVQALQSLHAALQQKMVGKFS